MSGATPRHEHGNSVAAWVTVSLIIVAFLVGAVGILAAEPAVFWIAAGLVIVSLGVGKLLAMAGYGSMPSYEVQEPVPTNLEGPDIAGPRGDQPNS